MCSKSHLVLQSVDRCPIKYQSDDCGCTLPRESTVSDRGSYAEHFATKPIWKYFSCETGQRLPVLSAYGESARSLLGFRINSPNNNPLSNARWSILCRNGISRAKWLPRSFQSFTAIPCSARASRILKSEEAVGDISVLMLQPSRNCEEHRRQ